MERKLAGHPRVAGASGVIVAAKTRRLAAELALIKRGDNRGRGMQDQDTRGRGVVQLWPGELNLFQLAKNLVPEVLNGLIIARLGRVCSELAVHLSPGDLFRRAQGEGAVGEPQVEIQTKRAALEGR